MVNTCCIRSCKTNKFKSSEIAFFKFPTSERLRRVWEDRVGFKADESALLCSRHFVKGRVQTLGDRRVLLKNSIPTQSRYAPFSALLRKTQGAQPTAPNDELRSSANRKRWPPYGLTLPARGFSDRFGYICSGYGCLVCHEKVHRMYEFLTDAHAHRSVSQRQLVCGHCLAGFNNFSDLMSHVTHIGADRRYVPEASASPVSDFVNYRRFPCSLCNAYFTSAISRDYHETLHTKKRNGDSPPVQTTKVDVQTTQADAQTTQADAQTTQADAETTQTDDVSVVKVELPPRNQAGKAQTEQQTTENSLARRKPSAAVTPSSRQLSHYATTVVCSLCNYSFVNLRMLDEHYRTSHVTAQLPLDLVFEEDFEYSLRPQTLCSVCVKRRSCVDTIQRLLEEATKDGV
ncbi:unnamed protein product [Ixodes hexagonus]